MKGMGAFLVASVSPPKHKGRGYFSFQEIHKSLYNAPVQQNTIYWYVLQLLAAAVPRGVTTRKLAAVKTYAAIIYTVIEEKQRRLNITKKNAQMNEMHMEIDKVAEKKL